MLKNGFEVIGRKNEGKPEVLIEGELYNGEWTFYLTLNENDSSVVLCNFETMNEASKEKDKLEKNPDVLNIAIKLIKTKTPFIVNNETIIEDVMEDGWIYSGNERTTILNYAKLLYKKNKKLKDIIINEI